MGQYVKRKPDAFANGLRTLAKDYDRYVREIFNKFKEKLKWDSDCNTTFYTIRTSVKSKEGSSYTLS